MIMDEWTDGLRGLRDRVQAFAAAREWQRFHTPRNLAMALAGEVGELLAELQWLTDEDVLAALREPHARHRLADEVADVLIYLVRFADVCGLDPLSEANAKIDRNEHRYPVAQARGTAAKYTNHLRGPQIIESSQDSPVESE